MESLYCFPTVPKAYALTVYDVVSLIDCDFYVYMKNHVGEDDWCVLSAQHKIESGKKMLNILNILQKAEVRSMGSVVKPDKEGAFIWIEIEDEWND